MAVTCMENRESRNVTDGKSAELIYTVRGTADESAAISSLKATAPSTFGNLVRQPVTIEPVHVDTNDADSCIWTGTARYAPRSYTAPPETGDSSFSFDTGGGTQHITQSLQTINKYAPTGKTAPDFKGAIGVTHNSVEGVDITLPVYNWSETHYIADEDVDKANYYSLTGRTNNASFKGCAAGECLFLGASGSKRGDDDWEITFRFASSPNKTNITVGDITGINKKGWEYLWVRYEDAEDATAKAIVKKPRAAYVEKVYEEGNFADLGIGT